ncbi:MAG: ABC transporter ATP-binding protein [Spirochaetes bacterium]|nr:ABC transporter ATP-binding protein [Spirochaetota bacterium]
MSILQAKKLSFHYDEDNPGLIKNFSYIFPEKGFVGVLGPNGCGKSTLLALFAGSFIPSAGKVMLYNKSISDYKSEEEVNDKVTFIFQNMEFETDETVINLLRQIKKHSTSNDTPDINILLDQFSISSIQNISINSISKGELQKVIICFALLYGPKILILDEPVFALSKEDSKTAFNILKEYSERRGLLIIFSVHDINLMETFSENVIMFMKNGSFETGKACNLMSKSNLELVYNTPYSMLKTDTSLSSVLKQNKIREVKPRK